VTIRRRMSGGREGTTTVKMRRHSTVPGWQRLVLRLSGAGLLLASGAVHLDLYLTGYRSIPTVGVLFLVQVATAFVLGAVLVVSGGRLVCAAAAGFAISTLAGYLLTLWVGLFGVREVRTAAGVVAGTVELAAFGLLGALAVAPGTGDRLETPGVPAPRLLDSLRAGFPGTGIMVAGFTLVVAVSVAIPVAFTRSSQVSSSATVLRIGRIGGKAVLTDAGGFTLYWFALDSSTRSQCNGTCAAYWPPLMGDPAVGEGVAGKVGTIKRADGARQATYDGHPLYTYVGDGAPGQANGNDLDLNGGVWHEVTASG
jgi:predicted lipoprotein with Yx(FWY)xxD motif